MAATASGDAAMLKFRTLESRVDIGFWSELATRKLDRYKLSDAPVAVQGTLAASRYAEVASRLELDADAFADGDGGDANEQRQAEEPAAAPPPPLPQSEQEEQQQQRQQQQRHRSRGTLFLSNSLDEFRALDRPALMRAAAQTLWRDLLSGAAERDASLLLPFFLIAHADLKRYVFSYQFAFPALKPPAPFMALGPGARGVDDALGKNKAAAALAACNAWRRRPQGGGEEDEEDEEREPPPPFWLVRLRGGGGGSEGNKEEEEDDNVAATCHPLSAWQGLTSEAAADDLLVAMADPCHLPLVPGWPLRNLLLMAAARWAPSSTSSTAAPGAAAAADGGASTTTTPPLLRLRVLCVRDGSSTGRASAAEGRSFVVDVAVPPLPEGWKGALGAGGGEAAGADAAASSTAPDALGWEPDSSGRPVPRELDLSPHLSPLALAEQAVALNLRLMRWRAAPELDLPPIANCRCLLLGAGTLGCAVARTLLAWGVRKITFLDSGRVAYSNPVRQSLFEHRDCLEGGRPKAAAAAQALSRVFPGVEAEAVEMRIPMPGHGGADDAGGLEADAFRLDALVQEHDAVFLLTDTRESRWLPTLLAAARRKVAITAALGFDGYLVMRHGVEAAGADDDDHDDDEEDRAHEKQQLKEQKQQQEEQHQRVGCYFCQDVVAPADSTRARPLDQQCTVARPGLAPIAGALSAELLAALLQHPLGVDAPAATAAMGGGGGDREEGGGVGTEAAGSSSAPAPPPPPPALGPVPHMIRGQLSGFSQVCMSGRAFPQCTACGPAVVRAWRERGPALAREAAGDPSALERLTGLAALREDAERRVGGGGDEGKEKEEEDEDDDDDWVDL